MIYYLSFGIILGLSAGFAPGPLLTLVISETLKNGTKSGIKIALAPIITDIPIIIGSLFIFSKLTNFHTILGVVSLFGGCFVLYMGYECIRTKGNEIKLQQTKSKSLTKGVLTNAFRPHPYLFWLTVGTPTLSKALSTNIVFPWVFIIAFYVCLVGSKILLAILVDKYKSFLSGSAYLFTMRFLGLVLGVLAVLLFIDGLKLLGIKGA